MFAFCRARKPTCAACGHALAERRVYACKRCRQPMTREVGSQIGFAPGGTIEMEMEMYRVPALCFWDCPTCKEKNYSSPTAEYFCESKCGCVQCHARAVQGYPCVPSGHSSVTGPQDGDWDTVRYRITRCVHCRSVLDSDLV